VIQNGDLSGEAARNAVKTRMRYSPEARKQNGFAWKDRGNSSET
jgi:hypothetical protein